MNTDYLLIKSKEVFNIRTPEEQDILVKFMKRISSSKNDSPLDMEDVVFEEIKKLSPDEQLAVRSYHTDLEQLMCDELNAVNRGVEEDFEACKKLYIAFSRLSVSIQDSLMYLYKKTIC